MANEHDPSRASDATCRRLAEAYHYAQDPRGSTKRETRLEDAWRAYQDECRVPTKLRTWAEANSDIATEIRCWRENVGQFRLGLAMGNATAEKLNRLCDERTAPDPAPQPCERRHLTEAEEALCNIVDAERALQRSGDQTAFRSSVRVALVQANAYSARDERAKTMGAATRASQDTPAASVSAQPVAAPAEPEPCSCEQSEALKRELDQLRAQHDTLRRLFDFDAQTCRDALDLVDELERELETRKLGGQELAERNEALKAEELPSNELWHEAAMAQGKAKLRTRAEVDAEIVRVVRSATAREWREWGLKGIAELIGEPTASDPAPQPREREDWALERLQELAEARFEINHRLTMEELIPELDRRIANLQEGHKLPRVQDVARIHELVKNLRSLAADAELEFR